MKQGAEFEEESQAEAEDYLDDQELERQVMMAEWGPILALPVKTRRGWVKPTMDENGRLDWGAFGTVDFSRLVPEFDKARYKADKLRDELDDELIMASIVSRRLPRQQFKVLRYISKGVLDLDDIENEDMRALAKLYLRVRRLRREIAELEEVSRERRKRRRARVLG